MTDRVQELGKKLFDSNDDAGADGPFQLGIEVNGGTEETTRVEHYNKSYDLTVESGESVAYVGDVSVEWTHTIHSDGCCSYGKVSRSDLLSALVSALGVENVELFEFWIEKIEEDLEQNEGVEIVV